MNILRFKDFSKSLAQLNARITELDEMLKIVDMEASDARFNALKALDEIEKMQKGRFK